MELRVNMVGENTAGESAQLVRGEGECGTWRGRK